ncbi:MAG TPA: glycosyltransferase family 2 protein, partial [Ktedonobacterales bacterium]
LGRGTAVDSVIQSVFPAPVYYLALLCLVGGNFIFFYTNVYACVRAGYYDLARYMLLGPLYWLLMSVAAWVALVSLIRNPFYWAKTTHGVSLGATKLGLNLVAVSGGHTLNASAVAAHRVAPSRTATLTRSRIDTDDKDAGPLAGAKSLSVILPAYNEEALIASTVRSVVETLSRWGLEFEVVVVNDGSRDRTREIIEALAARDRRIRPITHSVNRGYGAALVTGFESAENDLIFFMDSDGQFDIGELATFLPLEQQYDAVWGYRTDRKDTWMRRLNAWGWKQLVRLFLGVSVRDVDCAFKLFRAEFFRMHRLETRGAMINAELLYKLRGDGCKIAQVGVRHIERKAGRATGARPAVILRAIKELVLYTWRWRIASRRATAR